MKIGLGLAELGSHWCSEPVRESDAWGLPGTTKWCYEHA
jgi:hypothetical protein